MKISIISVSIRIQKEDVFSYLDPEFLTYTHYLHLLHPKFWTFRAYFAGLKTSVWALSETLPIVFRGKLKPWALDRIFKIFWKVVLETQGGEVFCIWNALNKILRKRFRNFWEPTCNLCAFSQANSIEIESSEKV